MRYLILTAIVIICYSKSLRPSHIQRELYCNSCQAIVKESLKRLKHKRGEADIVEAIDNICSPNNFPSYMFPANDMSRGCYAFLANHEEDLERVLQNKGVKDSDELLCFKISEACVGINSGEPNRNIPRTITINDKQYPVNEDGTVRLEDKEEI